MEDGLSSSYGLKLSNILGAGLKHTLGADAHLVLGVVFQETLDTATGELFEITKSQ